MQTTQQNPQLQAAFNKNDEYIEMLLRHSVLSKTNTNSAVFKANWEALMEIEVKMSAQDIIQNTKIAFSK